MYRFSSDGGSLGWLFHFPFSQDCDIFKPQAIMPLPESCLNMPPMPTDLAELLRDAITDSDETLHAIAKQADVDYGNLYRFVNRQREHTTLAVAGRLFDALGIVVKRTGVKRKQGK